MNITFPEAQHRISASLQVGVTSPVAANIGCLDGVQGRKLVGVAVPEITIPLNHKCFVWNESVHNELSADDFLLGKSYTEHGKDIMPSHLKRVETISMGESKYTIHAPEVCGIVSVLPATILWRSPLQSPSWSVEGFTTSLAIQDFAATTLRNGSLAASLFCTWGFLPVVCTGKRAEPCSSLTTRNEGLPAPDASIDATGVAPHLRIGARSKHLAAFCTPLSIRNVVHRLIIPWRIGEVKWN